jgi:hypothetical protein
LVKDQDAKEGESGYGWPFNLTDRDLKQWVNGVAEFQIQFKNITISKALEQAKTNINCYNWSVT